MDILAENVGNNSNFEYNYPMFILLQGIIVFLDVHRDVQPTPPKFYFSDHTVLMLVVVFCAHDYICGVSVVHCFHYC